MNLEMQNRRKASLRNALNPIISFLDKDSIIEIMLNPDGRVWVDEAGVGMYATDVIMEPSDADRIIRFLATSTGSVCNESNPSIAAKLPFWGARVQATIPPVVSSPVFAIRKPAKFIFTLDDYVEKKIMSKSQAQYISDACKNKKNILIGGGTGSGKTTFANAILQKVAQTGDRLYIIEDNSELQCSAENMITILVQPPFFTYHRAVMDALRYRPDRIIIGEVRDGTALDLLKAWNTGHPGGIATIHANNPESMLNRLCQLIEEIVPKAPRDLVAEAVDICVFIERNKQHPAGRHVGGIIIVKGIDSSGKWHLENLE